MSQSVTGLPTPKWTYSWTVGKTDCKGRNLYTLEIFGALAPTLHAPRPVPLPLVVQAEKPVTVEAMLPGHVRNSSNFTSQSEKCKTWAHGCACSPIGWAHSMDIADLQSLLPSKGRNASVGLLSLWHIRATSNDHVILRKDSHRNIEACSLRAAQHWSFSQSAFEANDVPPKKPTMLE